MPLVNLTKHPLALYDTNGALVEIPADARHLGVVALGDHGVVASDGRAFSVNTRTVTEVKGMPEPEAGTVFVVPVEVAMVLQADRADVVFPAEEATVATADGPSQRVTHLRRVVARLAPPA